MTTPATTATSLFSAVIREARTARELTQDQFAELCGVSQPAVVKWERGNPVAEVTLLKVAGALKLPLEALLFPAVMKGYREFQRHQRRKKERRRARNPS